MAKIPPMTTGNTSPLVPQNTVGQVHKARAKRVKQQRRTKPRGRGQ